MRLHFAVQQGAWINIIIRRKLVWTIKAHNMEHRAAVTLFIVHNDGDCSFVICYKITLSALGI